MFISGAPHSAAPVAARANFQPPWTIDVSRHRGLTAWHVIAITIVAHESGARSAVVQQATLDLLSTRRGPTVLDAAPTGSIIPLSTLAVDPRVAGELYGPAVQSALNDGRVVLGRTAAGLRRSKPGDTLEVADWVSPFVRHYLTVGVIVEDERVGGAEMLISNETANRLSFQRPSRLVVWGRRSAARTAVAARAREIAGARFIKASWEPPSVDSVLTQVKLKAVLGEFSIRRRANGLTVDPAWVQANVLPRDLPIIGPVACHRLLVPALVSALTEIQAGGLAGAINVADTRRAGGCFNGRVIRSESGSAGRNLSRHSWAGAIDINPSSNAFGALPRMDLRIVDVFRRHGFAWGGTWAVPDGMHFEYVGAPRVAGPPLPPTTTTTSTTTTSTTTTSTTSTTTTTLVPVTSTPPPSSASSSPSTQPSTQPSTHTEGPTSTAPAPTATTVSPALSSTALSSTTTSSTTTTPTATATLPPGTVETREPQSP